MKKTYWLKGLIWGIIIYISGILIVFITDKGEWAGLATMIVSIYLSPVIILGLLFGWFYGKIKDKKQIQ